MEVVFTADYRAPRSIGWLPGVLAEHVTELLVLNNEQLSPEQQSVK
jgi:hypothetical protein